MYDHILVPTDGSAGAVAAAEHAILLAEAFDATVHVVHAVDTAALGGAAERYPELEEAFGRRGREALRPIEDVAAGSGRSIVTETVRGTPHEAILRYAEEHDIELISMGTHGRTGVSRFLAGSVAERIVRLSDVPVLTVRVADDEGGGEVDAEPIAPYERVLVATDGEESASAAADHAIAIAEAFDATLHAVNAVDLTEAGGLFDAGGLPKEFVDRLDAEGGEATEAIAARARAAGVSVESAVRHGSPSEVILDYAAEADVDLIAMGTHGRTGLDHVLVGSVAERVVRLSDVPVLTVRRAATEAE
jgi:nucleotide-binding universal stress UspA family protein